MSIVVNGTCLDFGWSSLYSGLDVCDRVSIECFVQPAASRARGSVAVRLVEHDERADEWMPPVLLQNCRFSSAGAVCLHLLHELVGVSNERKVRVVVTLHENTVYVFTLLLYHTAGNKVQCGVEFIDFPELALIKRFDPLHLTLSNTHLLELRACAYGRDDLDGLGVRPNLHDSHISDPCAFINHILALGVNGKQLRRLLLTLTRAFCEWPWVLKLGEQACKSALFEPYLPAFTITAHMEHYPEYQGGVFFLRTPKEITVRTRRVGHHLQSPQKVTLVVPVVPGGKSAQHVFDIFFATRKQASVIGELEQTGKCGLAVWQGCTYANLKLFV